MIQSYYEDRNVILGDEMGLGKTMQTLAFLHHLDTYDDLRGPYLIVVPLITIIQWKRAFDEWTNMNCVVFHDVKSNHGRNVIKKYEWNYVTVTIQGHKLPSKFNKFKVLLISY